MLFSSFNSKIPNDLTSTRRSLESLFLNDLTSSSTRLKALSYDIFLVLLICLTNNPSFSLSIELKETFLLGGINSFPTTVADFFLRTKAPKPGKITQSLLCNKSTMSLKIVIK